ncbi:hypothetical protein Peur_069928 [Populus x canadensis]
MRLSSGEKVNASLSKTQYMRDRLRPLTKVAEHLIKENSQFPIIAKNMTRDYKSSKGKTKKGLRASFTLSSKLLNG